MSPMRYLPILVVVLSACSHQPQKKFDAVTNLFCDRYLIYRMCALDVTDNGQTDFLYFEDSREIFLYDPQGSATIPVNLIMHECAQSMDAPLIDATSLLLTVNEEMGFFRKSEIKNKIFYHYMRYVPRINRCNRERNKQEEYDVDDDPFLADADEFGL